MNGQLVHPAPIRLAAFARGELELDEIDEIQEHLARCDSCCLALDEVPDDRLLTLVRQTGNRDQRVENRCVRESGAATAETAFSFEDPTNEQAPLSGSQPNDAEIALSGRSDIGLPAELIDHPRYRVLTQIGKGGMGDVYLAEHRLMQRTVALKVINHTLIENPQAVERFRREVRAAASLSHANIVSAYDAEQAGGVHFLAMEYVEGTNLAEVVKERGPLAIEDACEFIRQAAAGLQHAHERGMIHRDIKPHNLMLAADGTVKILDFGLASLASEVTVAEETRPGRSELTTVSSVIGTPDYIAPEQASNARRADPRSDLYSLGATFYFLLAGQPPFPEGTVTDKLSDHAKMAPRPIREVREDVPEEVDEIISRLLAKDPTRRYPSAADLVLAIDRLSAGTENAATARSQSQAKRGEKSPSRRPERRANGARHRPHTYRRWLVASAAVLLTSVVAVFLLIGGSSSRYEPSDPESRPPVAQDKREAASGRVGRRHAVDVPQADQLQTAPLNDEFAFDFRHGHFDTSVLLPTGIKSRFGASLFKLEERGLRILIPRGQASSKPRLGFAPALDIEGDFEITATYEILSTEPVRSDSPDVGPSLYVLAVETRSSAYFRRCLRSDGGAYLVSWRTDEPAGTGSAGREYFPATELAGKLRLVRTGGVLSYLAQEGDSDAFRVLWQTEFGVQPIGLFRVESWAEGAHDTVDVLWKDLTIRAERLDAQPLAVMRGSTLRLPAEGNEPHASPPETDGPP